MYSSSAMLSLEVARSAVRPCGRVVRADRSAAFRWAHSPAVQSRQHASPGVAASAAEPGSAPSADTPCPVSPAAPQPSTPQPSAASTPAASEAGTSTPASPSPPAEFPHQQSIFSDRDVGSVYVQPSAAGPASQQFQQQQQQRQQQDTWQQPSFADQDLGSVPVQPSTPNFTTLNYDRRFRNQFSLIGHLGRDPELRDFASGNCVVRFPIALSKGPADNAQTEWYDVEAWSDLGRRCHGHLRKGAWINIMGRLKVDKYQGQDQQERKKTVLVAESIFHLLPANAEPTDARQGSVFGPATPRLTKDQLWAELAAEPNSFYDNRSSKQMSSQPDFVRKSPGREGLWVSSAPPGVVLPVEQPPY